jgi:hypothetical protein
VPAEGTTTSANARQLRGRRNRQSQWSISERLAKIYGGRAPKARFFKLFLCHFSGDAETSFIVLRFEKLAAQRELTPTELPERRIKAACPGKELMKFECKKRTVAGPASLACRFAYEDEHGLELGLATLGIATCRGRQFLRRFSQRGGRDAE